MLWIFVFHSLQLSPCQASEGSLSSEGGHTLSRGLCQPGQGAETSARASCYLLDLCSRHGVEVKAATEDVVLLEDSFQNFAPDRFCVTCMV